MPVHSFPRHAEAASFAADLIAQAANKAIAARGVFRLALSGGTTPAPMFRELADRPLAWDRVHIFWADERCVGPDSPESNFRQVRQMLLDSTSLPLNNIHRIEGEILPEERAARRYEQLLASCFGLPSFPSAGDREKTLSPPEFDCIHLGMGHDGHVASLFPGSEALKETVRWVIPVKVPGHVLPRVNRISLTLPVLNNAATVVVLIAGQDKVRVLDTLPDSPELPAALLRSGADSHWVTSP